MRKYGIFLLFIGALGVVWSVSSKTQRAAYLQYLGITTLPDYILGWRFPLDLSDARALLDVDEKITPDGVRTELPVIPMQATSNKENIVKELDAPKELYYSHGADYGWAACDKTQTRAVHDVDVPKIYQWKDEKGQTHFSDHAQHKAATFIGDQYAAKRQLFRLTVDFDGMPRNAVWEDKLRQAATQAFDAVMLYIPDQYHRQINLRVHLFASRRQFEDLRKRVMPGRSAYAFYSHAKNTIYMVKEPEDIQRMIAVARHETTHAILAGMTGPIPTWLNEGLAESIEAQFNQVKTIPADLTADDIRRVISFRPEHFYAASMQKNYQSSAKLVTYLRNDPRGRDLLKNVLGAFAEKPCQEMDSEALLTKYFGSIRYLANVL